MNDLIRNILNNSRDFNKEEAEAHMQALKNISKPTGRRWDLETGKIVDDNREFIIELLDAIRRLFNGDCELVELDEIYDKARKLGFDINEEGYVEEDEWE